MAQRARASILQRFEALPIIVVFLLLLRSSCIGRRRFSSRPTSIRPSFPTLPPLILLATGLTFVIGAGEIDLSFPSSTNGALLTRETAERCRIFGQVNVSIDSLDSLDGGAQAARLRAVDLLREAGIRVGIGSPS